MTGRAMLAGLRHCGWLLLLCLWLPSVQAVEYSAAAGGENAAAVMEAFKQQEAQTAEEKSAADHQKQVIMFAIGVPLLLLILITGALGIAMGVYGKPVFVLHTVFAGLTMTLALVHVVVGLVWFYPF